MSETSKGVLAALGACVIWGLAPIFYKLLDHVTAREVFAHRTLWSLVFFVSLLAVQGRLDALRDAVRSWRDAGALVLAAGMISINWFVFIWAVQVERATEASLGYFVYPLVAVALGVALLGERMRPAQVLAVVLAALAVVILTLGLGKLPWVALLLATSFALYGLIKKFLAVGPVVSVTAEVALIAPVALWLALRAGGTGEDGATSGAAFGANPVDTALLVLAGPLTATPLVLFSYAARRVAMSTVGLLVYLNPTLQFLVAVLIFAEPLGLWHAISFPLIWFALAVYAVSALRTQRLSRKAVSNAEMSAMVLTSPSSDPSAKP